MARLAIHPAGMASRALLMHAVTQIEAPVLQGLPAVGEMVIYNGQRCQIVTLITHEGLRRTDHFATLYGRYGEERNRSHFQARLDHVTRTDGAVYPDSRPD